MSERTEPPKILALPYSHLEKAGPHFGPLGSHEPAEIAERQRRPQGTLILENQQRGLYIARHIIGSLRELAEPELATRLTAQASINTSWYMFTQNPMYVQAMDASRVMNWHLRLPIFAERTADGSVWAKTRDEAEQDISVSLTSVLTTATDAYRRYVHRETGTPITKDRSKNMGRELGTAAIAMYGLSGFTRGIMPSDDVVHVQSYVHEAGKALLEDARTAARTIGTYPSIAQLADTESDLMVHWRRNAPKADIALLAEAHDLAHEAV